ncbi:hypothetical protein HOLleu_13995 [Holothuria leucospilota]|uniref:Uncharacterized protein n=1 Tax=Holothuria leucospilota TaxID=206669 RepID=A0A9Q1C803_HOLLE|nr:hypothetical protein HOLleu_13995 [Holothuria leucospilota]
MVKSIVFLKVLREVSRPPIPHRVPWPCYLDLGLPSRDLLRDLERLREDEPDRDLLDEDEELCRDRDLDLDLDLEE